METKKINFNEISNFFDDSKGIIMTALDLTNEDIPMIDEFFHKNHLVSDEAVLLNVYFVIGNVKGEEGRKDWLFEYKNAKFNPMVRLRMAEIGVTWICDYLENYKKDYAA